MCTISKQEMDLDAFAEDMRNHAWMADCEDEIQSDVINIENVEHVRNTEAFLFKRATDDGSVSTFHHRRDNKHDNENADNADDVSSTKKLRVDSVHTNDTIMMDVDANENGDGKQIHTLEIMLTSKEQEILSLRHRLKALSASGDTEMYNKNGHETPGTKDRSPSDNTGETPGQETDPGGNL